MDCTISNRFLYSRLHNLEDFCGSNTLWIIQSEIYILKKHILNYIIWKACLHSGIHFRLYNSEYV